MVGTALTIERERYRMLGALGMRVLVARGMRVSLLLVRGRSPGTNESCWSGWADGVLPLPAARTHEEGLPPETRIPGFWDSTVPVSGRKGEETIHFSTAQYRLEEPVL